MPAFGRVEICQWTEATHSVVQLGLNCLSMQVPLVFAAKIYAGGKSAQEFDQVRYLPRPNYLRTYLYVALYILLLTLQYVY